MRQLLLSILIATALFGELPPSVYEEMQKEAPESLDINVTKVETSGLPIPFSEKEVKVVATVLYVSRSQSDLKKGDKITIIYSTVTSMPPGWVGPSSLPILKEGESYSAYLKKSRDGTYYLPAARGRSFQ